MVNTYENFILKRIEQLGKEISTLQVDTFMWHRKVAQKDMLYIVLTAHDNNYENATPANKKEVV